MIERWLSLRELPRPVIARLLLGRGESAPRLLGCDFYGRYRPVRLSVAVGRAPGFVSSMWNWLVGPHRTKYMSFLPGSQLSGKEAEAMAFATWTFPAETLEAETYQYARPVAKVPEE